jgi:alkylation response protein AidB-like acyl-CoA dehydrogenase
MEGSYTVSEIESGAERKGSNYVLNGKKMFVPDAHIADYILFPARTEAKGNSNGISLFVVDAKSKGIDITPLASLISFPRSFSRMFLAERVCGQVGQGNDRDMAPRWLQMFRGVGNGTGL